MYLIKPFVAIIDLYLIAMVVVTPGKTSAACTARNGGVDIVGVVSGNVANCTANKCVNSVIDGCETVICIDVDGCRDMKITNTTNAVINGRFQSKRLEIRNVKNVTCTGQASCRESEIFSNKNGYVTCQGGNLDEPSCMDMKITAGCLKCGKDGCGCDGPDECVTFTDAKTNKTVVITDGIEKNYGQLCNRKKCKGLLKCFWSWLTGVFF